MKIMSNARKKTLLLFGVFLFCGIVFTNFVFAQGSGSLSVISTDKGSYNKGDVIIVWGGSLLNPNATITFSIAGFQNNQVDVENAITDSNGRFVKFLHTDGSNWTRSGKYAICMGIYPSCGVLGNFWFNAEISKSNNALPPPLEQNMTGISSNDITCKTGLVMLIKKSDGSPACVTPTTAQKLDNRGWGTLVLQYSFR
ncbi:MAG TPA: hypothetical protein VLT10_00475 [Verrucomicrobiae bacterium]|nr:hypothetical protein [Verrucomicrobiae bacterium]